MPHSSPAGDPTAQCDLGTSGKWVHLAKIAFEKYFLRKVRTGSMTPVYESYVLRMLGIETLKRAS